MLLHLPFFAAHSQKRAHACAFVCAKEDFLINEPRGLSASVCVSVLGCVLAFVLGCLCACECVGVGVCV